MAPPAASHGGTTQRPPRRLSRLFGHLSLPLSASQQRDSSSAVASPTGSSSALAPPAARANHHARPRRRSSTWSLLPLGSPLPTPPLPPLLAEQFSNPDDVAAFAEALQDDAGQQDVHAADGSAKTADQLGAEAGDAGEPEATPAALVKAPKVGRIAAASDFAPVRERRIRKPRAGAETGVAREGAVYVLLRFPLLLCVWATIVLQFLAYVLVRQSVNALEWVMAWRGQRGRLRRRLRQASSWTEWRTTAHEMDAFMGYDAWKNVRESGLYDWRLVSKVHKSLKAFREQDDAENLLDVLDLCIRNNFAGIESFRLYSETFWGTKVAIESYLDEAERALRYIQETDKIPLERKRAFWRTLSKNLGKTALCLSGGGSFGYYHIGLVRALLDANLLPNIVTGTSAGGLIAALACTRTDEELREILVPELADRITACWEPISIWGPRVWRTGARFDTVQWAEKAQYFTRGSMTFLEAHRRTGKILNVSVIPADRHSPVKLLNYITAPNCIIWSALLASAAVPGIMNPVCLMQKHPKTGKAETMSYGHRYKDGSLRVDIPLSDLHALYNVNYPIVSQVNPHVHLFFFAPKGMPGRPVAHRRGKGWRGGFILSAAEHIIKLHLSLNFKVLRDLQVQPRLLGQDWSNVFLQRFSGAVTIWPRTRAWDWVRILSDPDRKELRRMMQVSQSTTFPKLHMIDNRRRLEAAVEQGRHACRRAQRAQNATAQTPGGSNVHTDGQLSTSRLSDESAAETSGPGATGGDFFSSKRVSSQPTRLRDMARMVSYNSVALSDEGGATPGEPETPGELPRHARLRSLGHNDEYGGSSSGSITKRPWSRDHRNGSGPGSDGVREHDFAGRDGGATTDEEDNGEPLTAAALSPRHLTAAHHDSSRRSLPRQHSKSKDGSGPGGHQWGDRGSMSAGGGLRWDEGDSSESSDEE